MSEKMKVTLVKSGVGCPSRHRKTLVALGLTRIGRTIEIANNSSVLGMIDKVKHLVTVSGQ